MDFVENSTSRLVQTSITYFFTMKKNFISQAKSKQKSLSLKKTSREIKDKIIDLTDESSDNFENVNINIEPKIENNVAITCVKIHKKRKIDINEVKLKYNYNDIISSDENDSKNEQMISESIVTEHKVGIKSNFVSVMGIETQEINNREGIISNLVNENEAGKIELKEDILDEFLGVKSKKRRVSNCDGNDGESTPTLMELYTNKGLINDTEINSVSENLTGNVGEISIRQDLLDNSHTTILEPEIILHEEVNKSTDAHVGFMKIILNDIIERGTYKHLFSADQIKMYHNLVSLDFNDFKFCIRLFYRKNGWHRLSILKTDSRLNLDYSNIEGTIKKLANYNIMDTNTTCENVNVLLNLLSVSELKDIMNNFKLKIRANMTKEMLVERILQNARQQKTILFVKPNMLDILLKTVSNKLGICIRITENFRGLLLRCHLLYAITEHGTPQEIHRLMWETNAQKYITSNIDTLEIFENESEFSEYEKYRFLYEEFFVSIENKNRLSALEMVFIAYEKLLKIIDDEQCIKKVSEIPSFLKKFTIGNCIIGIISSGIQLLKQEIHNIKNSNSSILPLKNYYRNLFNSEILEYDHICIILDNLLKQKLYKKHKKSEWLKEKILILKRYKKDYNGALEALLKFTRNEQPLDDELLKLYVNTEIKTFIKSKNISEENRQNLQVLQSRISCVDNFVTKVISAVELPDTKSGHKTIYKISEVNGESYNTVEEIAINYYKENENFEEGIHGEGAPLYLLFTILFWDIIYEHYIPYTFISLLQKRPLDFYSTTFYTSRRTVIDERLTELENCTTVELEEKMQKIIQNGNNSPVLNSVYCDINLLKIFIKCIKRDVLVKIFKLLAKNHGTYKAGFPDLILWNIQEKKYKFVEVKGRRDQLRPKQILWLRYLQEIGAETEICEVNTRKDCKINHDSS